MEKKLTNSGPLREPAGKHSIYTPLAFHSNIGFVHAPAEPHRPLAAVQGFL